MAATITNAGGGALVYNGGSGITGNLTISTSGSNTRFVATGETITNSFGSGTAGPAATIDIPTANIVSISVDLKDGTNTLTCNTLPASNPLTFAPSAGTNTFSIGTSLLTGILSDITASPTGGTTAALITGTSASVGYTAVITSTTVTGMLGATADKTFTYSSGSLLSLTITGQNSSGGSDLFKIKSTSVPTTVSMALGTDTAQVGTVAGSSAGLDGITAALTITNSSGQAKSLRIDDTGSATGNKTYTITPNAAQTSNSTIACSSFSTISFRAGTTGFTTLYQFDGSSVGSCTFTIAANFLDNATVNGNGGNTNNLNVSGIAAGWSLVDNTGGSFTVTQSNAKTISATKMAAVTPYIASVSAPTGSTTVGGTLSTPSLTVVGGGTQSFTYLWKHGDGSAAAGTATGSTYTTLAGDVGFTMIEIITPSSTEAGTGQAVTSSATGTITGAASGYAPSLPMRLGLGLGL